MINNELISICIPVYNGEKYIEETLNSIINQTYQNIEIIVSDNASTDNTYSIVKQFMDKDSRVKYYRNETNLGYSGNLNKLIDLANSEYIAIYHADDIYANNIIEKEVDFLNENSELAGCFTLGKMIDSSGTPIKNKFIYNETNLIDDLIIDLSFFIKRMYESGNVFICPTSMIKKRVYQELNGYSMDVKFIEDQDMWTRILEKYKLGIVAKELISYRVHDSQGSSYYSASQRKELAVDLKYLEDYLNANEHFKSKYDKILNERIALDYIKLAKYSLHSHDYTSYKKNILESRKYFRNLKNTNKRLIQNSNIFCSYIVRRIGFFLGLK